MRGTVRSRSALVVLVGAVMTVTGAHAAGAAKKPFKPKTGTYNGSYTASDGSRVQATAKVGKVLSPRTGKRVSGVTLQLWRGVLKCADGSTSSVQDQMTAVRNGRNFSSKVKVASGATDKLSGNFPTETTMEVTARVRTGGGAAQKCNTGKVKFTVKWSTGLAGG
jgi:hypothetical protein